MPSKYKSKLPKARTKQTSPLSFKHRPYDPGPLETCPNCGNTRPASFGRDRRGYRVGYVGSRCHCGATYQGGV